MAAPARPLGVQPLSSLIYGTYTALVYVTPFFGGFIADRWLGQRYSGDRRRHRSWPSAEFT